MREIEAELSNRLETAMRCHCKLVAKARIRDIARLYAENGVRSYDEKYTKRYNPKSQIGTSLTVMAINGMLETKTDHKIDGRISHLNPLYVADMMGFPLTWLTSPFLSQNGDERQSKPWETPGYHR